MLHARTLNFAPFEVNSTDGSQHNTRGRNKKVGSNTKQSTNQGNQRKHFPGLYLPILIILENLIFKRGRHIFKQSLLCLQKILKHVWANKLLFPACSRIIIKHITHHNKQSYHRVQTFVIIPVHLTFEEKLKCFHSNILLKLLSILLNVLAALTENKLLLQLKRL